MAGSVVAARAASTLLAAAAALRWSRPDLTAALAEHVRDTWTADRRVWVAATGWVVHGHAAVGDGGEHAAAALAEVAGCGAGLLDDPAADRLRIEVAALAVGHGEPAAARLLVAPVLGRDPADDGACLCAGAPTEPGAELRADALTVLARCAAEQVPAVDVAVRRAEAVGLAVGEPAADTAQVGLARKASTAPRGDGRTGAAADTARRGPAAHRRDGERSERFLVALRALTSGPPPVDGPGPRAGAPSTAGRPGADPTVEDALPSSPEPVLVEPSDPWTTGLWSSERLGRRGPRTALLDGPAGAVADRSVTDVAARGASVGDVVTGDVVTDDVVIGDVVTESAQVNGAQVNGARWGGAQVGGGPLGGAPEPFATEPTGTACVVVDVLSDGPHDVLRGELLRRIDDRLTEVLTEALPAESGARTASDGSTLSVIRSGWEWSAAADWMHRTLPDLFAAMGPDPLGPRAHGVTLRAVVHVAEGPVGAQLLYRIDDPPGPTAGADRPQAEAVRDPGERRPFGSGRHRHDLDRPVGERGAGPSPAEERLLALAPEAPTTGSGRHRAARHRADVLAALASVEIRNGIVGDRAAGPGAGLPSRGERPHARDDEPPVEELGLADLLAGALAAYRSI